MEPEQLGQLFADEFNGNPSQQLNEMFPMYPLNSPGMPLPGPQFIEAAISMGDPPPGFEGTGSRQRLVSYGNKLSYLYRRALYDENFQFTLDVRNIRKEAPIVPGHLLADNTTNLNGGPRRANVMLIGKMPGREEVRHQANLVGPTAEVLVDALEELGVTMGDRASWYCTNLVKWPQMDEQSSSLPIGHKKECAILLEQELRLVQPDYVLCLGSDASKWLLGTNYGVQSMIGRAEDLTINLFGPDEDPMYHTMKVMAIVNPAQVYRVPEMYDEFKDQLALFVSLTNGAEVGGREDNIDHRNVYKHRELKRIVDEIRSDPDPLRRIIAIDGEWNGDHPGEPGAFLRTIQFSSKHGEGINVVLRHQGGSPAFKPSIDHALHELKRLFKTDAEAGWHPRIGGHFLRADLPWLIHAGIDCRDEYMPPPSPERMREDGGFETGLMYHAFNETASYRLTDMTVRLTTAPVYDTRLKDAITQHCKDNDIKKEDLEGFGFLPAWVLHPGAEDPEAGYNYAAYDPDVTRRIAMRHLRPGGMLDGDWNGNPCWEPYWRSHKASLGVLSMEMNGIMLDRERIDKLTLLFTEIHATLMADFRNKINWPEFNPDSPPQCVALLFGGYDNQFLFKTGKAGGRIPPEGATVLDLMPIKTTGKRSKLWADVVARGEQNQHRPSTDKEVLGIIGHANPIAMQLRDIKFIGQVLKTVLRRPTIDKTTGEVVRDDDGNIDYEKGMASFACSDGRVRTHLSMNKETGRGAAARPNLMAISKRREGDYSRIMGYMGRNKETGEIEPMGDYLDVLGQPRYEAPIRTIFCSSPGHVLVETDYTGAELAMISWLANDEVMIDHVRRNSLPESHEDHYDIHAQRAVKAFHLDCRPTKSGLKDAGLSPLRVAAKNVNFGIPYGRGAEAIARQCREEGTDVSEHECQQMIDGYYDEYRGVGSFLQECERRSQDPGWVAGPFGRMRRFVRTRDRAVVGEQQRQAKNFPIQNGVADAVWTAISNFHSLQTQRPEYMMADFREAASQYYSVTFRMLLPIHDALLFECPIEHLRGFIQDEYEGDGVTISRPSALRFCMVHAVPIYPRFLSNHFMNVDEPYRFGIDVEVQQNWGEDISEELAQKLGIPADLI